MSPLLEKFSSIIPLSAELQDRIKSYLIEEHLQRKTRLLTERQISKKIYFIYKGFARAYYYKKGKDYTTWFLKEGDFIVSIHSFFTQTPSFEEIELLEDGILQSITYDQLQQLYKDFPEFNIVGRILTEHYYLTSETKSIDLRMYTATERYHMLIESYPTLLQRAILGQIASYLGVSQETLSRIRANKP